jgi:hypothetical protein
LWRQRHVQTNLAGLRRFGSRAAGFARLWRSSVFKALIEQAPCSVLVVITQ